MEDVAQQDEGKSEIQATKEDWEATARMYHATLERERAEHRREILKLKEDKRLANELCGLLSKHCGEAGDNEGAVDTLKRKLSELEVLQRGCKKKPEGLRSGAALAEEGSLSGDVVTMRDAYLKRISELTKQKDGAYAERNQVLALLARMAVALGWKVGVGQHPEADTTWEKDWRTILFIELPTSQASWHFHDSEVHLLAGLPAYEGAWDGHTTPEKYDRVNHALRGGVAQVVESEEVVALERARAERFLPPISLPQHEEILNGFSSSTHGAAAREAYMKRHGLVYVEGVLHWQGDQTPATNPECQPQ